jgi:hypothetical protein
MRESYAGGVAWLELLGEIPALAEMCAISREDVAKANAARVPGRGSEQRTHAY